MTLSSIEVKYKTPTNNTTEIAWLRNIFSKLGLDFLSPSNLWCDNQSVY